MSSEDTKEINQLERENDEKRPWNMKKKNEIMKAIGAINMK